MLYVKNLHKSYQVGKNKYEVLKGIDFHVGKGEFVAVMGPSGSGKTTLLNCISCYIPFDQGEITIGGARLAGQSESELAKLRNTQIGFVFQDYILVPRIIQEEVSREAQELADKLTGLFGISHIVNKYPAEISGGEKQRAAVARSLINNPLIILADEPTGNLDSKSSRAVIESFGEARERMGATIFMVTHDSFAASFCDRVVLLKDGSIYRQLENSGERGSFHDKLLAAIKEMAE